MNGERGAVTRIPTERTPREHVFQTPALQKLSDAAWRLSNWRYMWLVLFGLGLLRSIGVLLAYPPAHGSDSFVYFLYVERLRGYDLPLISQTAPPLYPLVLYGAVHVLKSVYWLIGAQFIASAALAPLFYQGLKKVNPLLALGAALVILGDTQVAVVFNFTHTEPLYITLLALALVLFVRVTDAPQRTRRVLAGAFIVGGLLVLLLLTRSVARYLIVAFALVMLLRSRDLTRTAALVGGFALTAALWLGISAAAWGDPEGASTSNHMVFKVVAEKPDWVARANGPHSARYLDLRADCQQDTTSGVYFCLHGQIGDWDETAAVINGVYTETITANRGEYIREIIVHTREYLALSGKQYGLEAGLPSEVQCRTADTHVQGITADSLRDTWWAWILPDHPNYSAQTVRDIRAIQRHVLTYMCPPLEHSPQAKRIVDIIATRYRSLSRPRPLLWYAAALGFALAIPWARRRYLTVVLIFGGVLAMHALASAVTFNVQPRYVVVTNPLRATLLLFVVFVLGMTLAHVLDRIAGRLARRTAHHAQDRDA